MSRGFSLVNACRRARAQRVRQAIVSETDEAQMKIAAESYLLMYGDGTQTVESLMEEFRHGQLHFAHPVWQFCGK